MASEKVLVGIDGSERGQHVLAWAIRRQPLLGRVQPMMVYQPTGMLDRLSGTDRTVDNSTLRRFAEAHLAETIAAAKSATGTESEIVGSVAEGRPGPTLVEAAKDHDLVVLGTRGRGGLGSALLGSVSSHCARYAPVPVLVVPDDAPVDGTLDRAVVGVDGSANAVLALRWALQHVEPGGTVYAVGAVTAWSSLAGQLNPSAGQIEQQVRAAVDDAISQVIPELDHQGPEVVIRTCREDARLALRTMASADGDLLVVGARGLNGLTQLVLGSVSDALIHHPTVPTVVIPSLTGQATTP